MALIHFNHFSNALGKASACFVTVPDQAKAPLPVVYLLHGHSDDYTIWQRRTSIERYAEQHGVLVVMPDGGRGWYSDARDGVQRYESHILETIDRIDALFQTRADRDNRAIAGLSMGGYGAMKIALKHPDRFSAVVAHSAVFDMKKWHRDSPRSSQLRAIFGDRLPTSEDPFALAKASVRSRRRPRIRVDCGVDDFLIEQNRAFHRHLDKLGIPHVYDEHPGAHTWAYWDLHVQSALTFLCAGFTKQRSHRRAKR